MFESLSFHVVASSYGDNGNYTFMINLGKQAVIDYELRFFIKKSFSNTIITAYYLNFEESVFSKIHNITWYKGRSDFIIMDEKGRCNRSQYPITPKVWLLGITKILQIVENIRFLVIVDCFLLKA